MHCATCGNACRNLFQGANEVIQSYADRPSRHAKRSLIPSLAPVFFGMPLDEASVYAVSATNPSAGVAQMNYYSFHIGDYAVHTRHLSLMEDLAYRRCLDLYYTRESFLPSDVEQVARLIGMRDFVADVAAVLQEFFSINESGWSHARCDSEIKRMNDAADRARTNGKAGGRPKKNPLGSQSVRSGNPEETQSKATQYPIPNTQEEIHTPPSGFVDFWASWPKSTRKGGKAECEKLWSKLKLETCSGEIVAHVRAMSQTEDWRKQGGEFIPAPAVYLRGKRWDGADVGQAKPSLFEGAI